MDKIPLKIVVAAHMDEVGFVVRSISPEGMLWLLPVGGVKSCAKDMQLARVVTLTGDKYRGLLNSTRDESGKAQQTYMDLGLESEKDVRALGIREGDAVFFDTRFESLQQDAVSGKALDDRAGCYVIAEVTRRLADHGRNDIFLAGTSSEEVGARGGMTVSEMLRPDLFIAVDTANHDELDRGFRNHRQLGAGPMVEHYDKTMSPSPRLLSRVRDLLDARGIPYQCDMFGGGGTDAGTAHLVGGGRLALVLGIPLRYCHGCCSFARMSDLDHCVDAVVALCEDLTTDDAQACTTY